MATKADLENEIAELRRELDEARDRAAAAEESATEQEEASSDSVEGTEKAEKGRDSTLDWALGQLDGSEVDRLFREFVAELEDMQEHKPLLTLFGAFLLGYVLGRAR